MANQGAVYLVGTGPGEPGLITVKGLALIREADALVADALTYARFLQEARPETEIYDIGSRRAGNRKPQAEINQLLLKLAQQGKRVVRLHGGDPFVFGRAAQEMAEVRRAGIRVEPVPGVTSAVAAPAYAGVPVIDWEHAASLAVVSGYQSKNPTVRPDWSALAGVDTLVILMPLESLPQIVRNLLAAGRPADTPALAIQQGTLPQQKQVSATLDTIALAVQDYPVGLPAIVVIGAVANLASELAWFQGEENYPLQGQRVLVTRPAHQAADFMVALRSLGAEPVSFPTIEIRPVEDSGPLDEAIRRIGDRSGEPYYDWLVLTSVNGVAAFWKCLQQAGLDSRSLARLRLAAIGPATAAALQQRSIDPDLVPEVYTAEGVLAAFDQLGPVRGQRFLLARADIARRTLAEGLAARGAVVEEIAAYRTVPIEHGSFPPAADIVTFTSSSTVQGYVNCLGDRSLQQALRGSQVVCIGPVTAATARESGLPVSAVAEEYTIEGIIETLRGLKQ